ncbi:Protein of unknown function [Sinomicrobium oceani]|uniref:DUF2490 domain-containing protein n=1 Tax=Sinomicrobium oceani TaxID=1150368 RepID=A0A1K1NLD4_9FLAO|nr:DUF2490 domain-containing protein [Sinomicrobium oceani]SFW36256.1 Protein of unknown function [Sinomicrobium oceani]
MSVRAGFYIILFIFFSITAKAQIAPPGLGDVNSSAWFAVGVKEDLFAEKNITSTTFVGIGTTNSPEDHNPLDRGTIYVINQEVEHQFARHWKYSGALSYRWQNQFDEADPYDGRQEIRLYGRYSYLHPAEFVSFSFTFRPELRLFYDTAFDPYKKSAQFRTRFSGKMSVNLSADKAHKLVTMAEVLLSSDKKENWGVWEYGESRFSVYYSLHLPKYKATLNFGYMNNLLGKDFYRDAHYVAFDIVLHNIFRKG